MPTDNPFEPPSCLAEIPEPKFEWYYTSLLGCGGAAFGVIFTVLVGGIMTVSMVSELPKPLGADRNITAVVGAIGLYLLSVVTVTAVAGMLFTIFGSLIDSVRYLASKMNSDGVQTVSNPPEIGDVFDIDEPI